METEENDQPLRIHEIDQEEAFVRHSLEKDKEQRPGWRNLPERLRLRFVLASYLRRLKKGRPRSLALSDALALYHFLWGMALGSLLVVVAMGFMGYVIGLYDLLNNIAATMITIGWVLIFVSLIPKVRALLVNLVSRLRRKPKAEPKAPKTKVVAKHRKEGT